MRPLGLGRKTSDKETFIDRLAHRLFQPLLHLGLRFPKTTLAFVGAITIATTILGFSLGSEFVPRLNEGTIVINTIRLASVSLEESLEYGSRIEALLKDEFPDEIDQIWSRTGTAEVATDPMGFEVTDVYISLKPRKEWKRAKTQDELVSAMAEVTEKLPGMRAVYSQPIEMRINEMVAGIRADLGIKLFGDDLEVLKEKAAEIERVVKSIQGRPTSRPSRLPGFPCSESRSIRDALSRYGVPARHVLDAITEAGGIKVGEVLEPGRRFPARGPAPDVLPGRPEGPGEDCHPHGFGPAAPAHAACPPRGDEGPSTIQREWGQRRIVVQANIRGRDMGSFVKEAQERIEREVKLESGYYLDWGGQFENMQRAERRLFIVVPLALALILSLLYLTFHSVRDALMIFSGVLFARVGGVFGLWVMGLPFTISAGVGFVALAGASMLEGLVLVSAIRDRIAHGMPKREAIEQARLARLRPVLMTGTVAALGFLPMMLSTGIGAEVQRPLATVVFFGMVCDTFLTMLALPVLYLLFGEGGRNSKHFKPIRGRRSSAVGRHEVATA